MDGLSAEWDLFGKSYDEPINCCIDDEAASSLVVVERREGYPGMGVIMTDLFKNTSLNDELRCCPKPSWVMFGYCQLLV